jgi:PhnB protein
MTVTLNPYLNFRGTAREAITFYQSVLGGELTVGTFADFGMEVADADTGLVMHSQLTGGGLTLMASDIPSHMDYAPGTHAFSVSLTGDDEAALTGYWQKLLDGAVVSVPLSESPWGDSFGQLVDKFGVSWLVNISAASAS